MLIIGHRGAADLAPENSMEALQAGFDAAADMLEFDVRLTKDKIPVLVHDFHTLRTHHNASIISRLTLEELKQHTEKQPIVTLEEVLDVFFGKIVLNIELKGRGTGTIVTQLLRRHYINKKSDWGNVFLSSFKGSELAAVRRLSKEVNISMLHIQNPFIFIAYHRRLQLSAVGFHRLYVNVFALEIAKRIGLLTYVYTVNHPETALMLARQGVDAIVTDNPRIMIQEIERASS